MPTDNAIRRQALDITQSFAVSAPAGSGKTGLLTQRVLALLAQCGQPENILAITFTKKAAAEMQTRILTALRHAQNQLDPPADEYERLTWELAKSVLAQDQQQQWRLLSLPHRLRITTIDSFCRQLSQQMPLDNRLGHISEVLDGTEMDRACQLAIHETLALLETKGAIAGDLAKLIRHFNNRLATVEALFTRLLKRRDQWLGPLLSAKDQRQKLESNLRLVILNHLAKLQQQSRPFASEWLALANYAATQLQALAKDSAICVCAELSSLPKAEVDAIKQWQGLAHLLLTQAGDWRKSVDKRIGFPAADASMDKEQKAWVKQQKQRLLELLTEVATEETLRQLLHGVRHLPSPEYTEVQWQLLDSLTRILIRLVAELKIVFQQLGKTDYIEITLAALQALGDEQQPTDLALKLDYRIQHILVDEFQDTSGPQLELLQRLTTGWQTNDGRTLFIVGDAMQSCYGFRDANVGIFLDCRRHGLGDLPLIPLDLRVNFRSQRGLVDWFNQVFPSVMPGEDDTNLGAVAYQPASAFLSPTEAAAVSSFIFASTNKPKVREIEAEKIADLIQSVQHRSPGDSIAILVRKRQQVSPITQVLKDADIAYRATDIDRLYQKMVVQDLLTLTRAMLYPNDRIAWLGLLRAPWCGLHMADLHCLANTKVADRQVAICSLIREHSDLLSLSEEGRQLLDRLSEALNLMFEQQGRRPLHQWIESGWLELGGHSLLVSEAEAPMVERFFACLQQHEVGWHIAHWDTFVAAVSQLFADADSDVDQHHSCVEIMTIHKAKGLEFDHVILPGLDLLPAADKKELLLWQHWLDKTQRNRLLISPVHASGDERDPIYDYIRESDSQKQALEADRLLYVACTRAIKQLYLMGYVTTTDKEAESQETLFHPAKGSALASLWPHIASNANRIYLDNDQVEKTASGEQHPNRLLRQSIEWRRPEYPITSLLADYTVDYQGLGTSEDLANTNSAAELIQRESRYFGTVLHLALQQVTESDCLAWDTERIARQSNFWQLKLEQMGCAADLAQKQTLLIADTVAAMLSDDTGQWLLDNRHQHSACELALWTQEFGSLKHYVIDRTFVDQKTNHRWVIDYKATPIQKKQTQREFIRDQEQRYYKQLLNYANLFKQNREPIRIALYFPLLLVFHELSFP